VVTVIATGFGGTSRRAEARAGEKDHRGREVGDLAEDYSLSPDLKRPALWRHGQRRLSVPSGADLDVPAFLRRQAD